jgi:ATP-binding protein involved in chromosome partitioning
MSWLSSLKSVFSPAQEVKEDEIQTVLQNYVLPHSENALKDRISQVNVQGRILQLTINTFPQEKITYNRFTTNSLKLWKNAVSKS